MSEPVEDEDAFLYGDEDAATDAAAKNAVSERVLCCTHVLLFT